MLMTNVVIVTNVCFEGTNLKLDNEAHDDCDPQFWLQGDERLNSKAKDFSRVQCLTKEMKDT
jgi:hypothetical protein